MNTYTLEYNSYSMFLRQKSNEKYKERLDDIKSRKKNLYLPDIKSKASPRMKTESCISQGHKSIMDLEKSFEVNMNNKRLFDRIEKIKTKENIAAKQKVTEQKKEYNNIQRKIILEKIQSENKRLQLRIDQSNAFINPIKLDKVFSTEHVKVIKNMKKVKDMKTLNILIHKKYQLNDKTNKSKSPKKSTQVNTVV
jgi:hypothetical protein